ncbi:MAG TPA: alpha/beta hydrolase [Anaerolineales bacterium]|nr:alpha/beta hydrolase [Anaerolineales bacterium]HNN13174.1 alpha/beta hydrolase [Anaerolineales bacterium]HNO30931.1 alpha/beta hydrolase [Anaerolineales bacterium]
MVKRINWKSVAAVFALALLVVGIVFVVWASDASAPTDVAISALTSDAQVTVSEENGWLVFRPTGNPQTETGFIFYPGGKVDYRAYAPALRQIAAKGFFVVVTPAPLNLAFFDVNAAARIQAAYPEIQNWFVGGHSLGGVAASSYAAGHSEIKGVIFWASYPANDALKTNGTKVISIYGTNDGLAGGGKIDESKALLPADAQFVAIEGGNHAQFGSYGPQAGDNEATISPEQQWAQAAEATAMFLESASR